VKNGGRYHQEFLGAKGKQISSLVAIAVTISIPDRQLHSSKEFIVADQGGGAKMEGRPNSTILAVEGSWQSKKGIV
jgi:hypothetical protein